MYIQRNLEAIIIKYLKAPEIIAIVGPRQAGKTTLIQHLFKKLDKAISLSFDDLDVLTLFEKDINAFISTYIKGNKYLFIDEFQQARNGGKILKYIHDSQKIKIIISGSSVADLTIRALKYLVGRILIFELYTFDFAEFLRAKDANYLKVYQEYKNKINFWQDKKIDISAIIHKKLLNHYQEYLLFGGYPRVVIEEDKESKKRILKNIYNTFFLREVKDILGLIDDYKLNNLIKGLSLQIANLIEYNELSRLSGYSYLSLKKYLNFLEKTYICRLVRPFYKNKRTEVVKNPKIFFLDTGLRNIIADDFRSLDARTDKGMLLENGLASQFIKQDKKINFWRDKKKNEIDFIMDLGNNKIIAVESKSYLKNNHLVVAEKFQKKYSNIDLYFSYTDIDSKIKDRKRIYPVYLY